MTTVDRLSLHSGQCQRKPPTLSRTFWVSSLLLTAILALKSFWISCRSYFHQKLSLISLALSLLKFFSRKLRSWTCTRNAKGTVFSNSWFLLLVTIFKRLSCPILLAIHLFMWSFSGNLSQSCNSLTSLIFAHFKSAVSVFNNFAHCLIVWFVVLHNVHIQHTSNYPLSIEHLYPIHVECRFVFRVLDGTPCFLWHYTESGWWL